jgi:hypothetical protein
MKICNIGISASAILALLTIGLGPMRSLGQTNPNFNQITPNVEGAIRLSWNSTPGEVYQIQYADSLVDTNTGITTWHMLYNNYPSQGTNTFWLDVGNYLWVPPVLHPAKSPGRFYRIKDIGPDTASDEPTVAIISPTNGLSASGELTVNVAASTDQPGGLGTKLFVDGQEMHSAIANTNWTDDTGQTNYVINTYAINTCEWPNGDHTLFATATTWSAPSGTIFGAAPVLEGNAVSPFVTATFNNLITRISFSETLFDPALGQTQQVSAVFAANADWTLVIRDINSNAVRNATGSGGTMLFYWDGNGDGGTNLEPGVYYYYISAHTNGLALPAPGPSSGGGGGDGPPSPFSASGTFGSETDLTQLLAAPANGSGDAAPLILYPPGTDTNDLIIFDGSMADLFPHSIATGMNYMVGMDSGSGGILGAYTGSSSQDAPAAPQRPWTAPKNGTPGRFGIGYQTYNANGSSPFTPALPFSTPGTQLRVQLEGQSTPPTFGLLRVADTEAINFALEMSSAGWSPGLTKPNDDLGIGDLRGSGTPFNQVDIGFLVLHCAYGTSQDYFASGCKQMYFPIASGTSAQYLRMSEMSFGGDGTNGLKWMALAACSSLYHVNWSSMQGQHIYPYTPGLHLLLGVDTLNYTREELGQDWVKFMLGDPQVTDAPQTIRNAWYKGATRAYTNAHTSYAVSPMKFAVAGDTACADDMLQTKTNTVFSGSRFYESVQVYPP